MTRCEWSGSDPLYIDYHDCEWGIPVHDDRLLFEFLILEGAQAGLSWLTILKKRENYRRAFHGFDFDRIVTYTETDLTRLLADSGIVRNRLKIGSAIKNAQGVLEIREEYGSLDSYLWRFVDGIPKQNTWKSMSEIPTKTVQSEVMSRDLKKRGFNFVGPTICYAYMQAVGMVNDHTIDCFRHKEIRELSPERYKQIASSCSSDSNLSRQDDVNLRPHRFAITSIYMNDFNKNTYQYFEFVYDT